MKNKTEISLFLGELPLVNTDEELQEVKKRYPNYDEYYIASGCIKDRKEKFENLWKAFSCLADDHFLDEVKRQFHQRTWEMYVGNVLVEKGLQVDSKNKGPDFIIGGDSPQIYIECIAPTKGDTLDSVPVEKFSTAFEVVVEDVPTDKMILRITEALIKKREKYREWISKGIIDSKVPFVVAINTGDLGHVEESSMPNVIKALFGFEHRLLKLKVPQENRELNQVTSDSLGMSCEVRYTQRDAVTKHNGSTVSVNLFRNPDCGCVSGVLFSSTTVLNHLMNIGGGISFVNNPFAQYPVETSFSKLFKHWNVSKDKIILPAL